MTIEFPEYLDLSGKLNYLKKQRKFTAPPKKPQAPNSSSSQKDATPQDYIDYGNALATFNSEYETWKTTVKATEDDRDNEIDSLCESLIKEESGLNNLKISQKQIDKIWSKAWQDVHSDGYYEAYINLCELVELFEY
jgi:hypothetical protein